MGSYSNFSIHKRLELTLSVLLMFTCHWPNSQSNVPFQIIPSAMALALQAVPSPSTPVQQRLVNTKCRLLLDIGRVPGTAMPPEWAASGARLALPNLEIEFRGDEYNFESLGNPERLLGNGKGSPPMSVDVVSLPKFVGLGGEQTVHAERGAYTLTPFSSDDDRFPGMRFRFFLDFPEGATRNDVSLPAERIYFTSECWLEEEAANENDDGNNVLFAKALESKRRLLHETEKKLKRVQEEMDEWDRDNGRIVTNTYPSIANGEGEGSNGGIFGFFRKAQGFRSRVLLLDKKILLSRRVASLKRALPDKDEKNVVRGPNNILFQKEGYLTVKRHVGFLKSEQYHIIGKFSITKAMET